MVFSSCYYLPLTARFYNLASGEIVNATLDDFTKGHGKISATLASGENLFGEYTLSQFSSRSYPINPYPNLPYTHREDDFTTNNDFLTKSDENRQSWPVEYGYSPNAIVSPLGTAILAGEKGTVLEIVIYSLNYNYSYGDGVGHDNKGNKYRVHIGDLSYKGK